MKGMTAQERYSDIAKISGLSEEIIRKVFWAEKQSIINSLKKGERASLIGRCVIRPEIRTNIVIGGALKKYVKLTASPAPGLADELKEAVEFDEQTEEIDNGIRLHQISALI